MKKKRGRPKKNIVRPATVEEILSNMEARLAAIEQRLAALAPAVPLPPGNVSNPPTNPVPGY